MDVKIVADVSEGLHLHEALESKIAGVRVEFQHRPMIDAEGSKVVISAIVSGEVPALLGFLGWIISKVGKIGGTLRIYGMTLVKDGECWENLIDVLRILSNFWTLISLSQSSGSEGRLSGEDPNDEAEGCAGAVRRLRKVFKRLVKG